MREGWQVLQVRHCDDIPPAWNEVNMFTLHIPPAINKWFVPCSSYQSIKLDLHQHEPREDNSWGSDNPKLTHTKGCSTYKERLFLIHLGFLNFAKSQAAAVLRQHTRTTTSKEGSYHHHHSSQQTGSERHTSYTRNVTRQEAHHHI